MRDIVKSLGPGVVTGASDDDPSGIATCAQAGAAAGLGFLWTMPLITPLMIAVQEMCARIGLVTGRGLTGVLRKHYARPVLLLLSVLVVSANTINIGADIAGMAEATHLLIPIEPWVLSITYAAIIIMSFVFMSYHVFAKYMKWLTLGLLLYVAVPFTMRVDWREALVRTFTPALALDRTSIMLFVALLGTTISPYLFFWQASIEVEDKKDRFKKLIQRWIVTKHELRLMREDVTLGMVFSNVVMWFIILSTAVTLFPNGITQIRTAQEAAQALRPIAGEYAYLFFTLGIVGTGLLAIPVLAGASSYVLSEAFAWTNGINKPFRKAPKFYLVMVFSTLIGVAMNMLNINPITALLYTAVIYGVISPPLILVIMHIANNKKIMGKHTNGMVSNLAGLITLVVMTVASVLFFVSLVR